MIGMHKSKNLGLVLMFDIFGVSYSLNLRFEDLGFPKLSNMKPSKCKKDIVLRKFFMIEFLMCFGDSWDAKLRFETLKDSLQVTKNHLFIKDFGISIKNHVIW